MVSNAHVQNRVKHFDLLLSRELVLIERRHEQNLITYKKLEQTIRHESKQIPKCTRKKVSLPLDEVYNDENPTINRNNKRTHTNDYPKEKPNISIDNFNSRPHQLNDKISQQAPKYRRLCVKAHPLPPIAPSHIQHREKRLKKDVHWTASFQHSNKENDNANDIFSALNQELTKRTVRETSHVEKQIHSFMDTLPTYEGVQKGFDNFGPSALYSNRATVAMR